MKQAAPAARWARRSIGCSETRPEGFHCPFMPPGSMSSSGKTARGIRNMNARYEDYVAVEKEKQERAMNQLIRTTTAPPPAMIQELEAELARYRATTGEGFGGDSDNNSFAPIIVCDVTDKGNEWHDRNGAPFTGRWLVTGTSKEIVFWKDGLIDQTKTIPEQALEGRDIFKAVEELNNATDPSTWVDGGYGPKPPWQPNFIVNLLNPATAEERRFISHTFGGSVCFHELRAAVRKKRRLFNNPFLSPVVEPRLTAYGKKGPGTRPYLPAVEWMEFGSTAAPAIEHKPAPLPIADDANGGPIGPEPPPHTSIPDEYSDFPGFE
jgi:hypothetical protein